MAEIAEARYMCVLCYACGEWERIVKNKDGSRWQGLIASPEYSNLEAFLMRHQQCPAEAITAELEPSTERQGESPMKEDLQGFAQFSKGSQEGLAKFRRFDDAESKSKNKKLFVSIHVNGHMRFSQDLCEELDLQNKMSAFLYYDKKMTQIGMEFLSHVERGAFPLLSVKKKAIVISAGAFLRHLGLFNQAKNKLQPQEIGDDYLIVDLNQ